MSLYGTRVLVLLVAALVPVAVLATAWVFDVARRERDQLERSVATHAERILAEFDGQIEGHVSALQALAATPMIDSGDLDGFRRHLAGARESHPLWRNVLLSGPDHVQILNLRLPDTRLPVAVPEYHQRVFATGRPALTPVAAGTGGGYRTAGVLVPVLRDGAVRQILTAVLDVSELARLVRETLPEGWRAIILDQKGRIVVRTSDGAAATGDAPSPSTLDALSAGREGEIRDGLSVAGERLVVTHLRSAATGWTVHVGLPVGALSVLQTRGLQIAASGATVSLLLSLLLAWLLFRELQAGRRQEAARAESQHLEALGRLTGGIAHDFNNLLMIMQSAAQGVRRRRDDPARVAEYADTIMATVQRGAAITRQLLSYARKERHTPSSFDLADRAADLRTLLAQSTRGNIETRLVLPRGIWRIYADPNALEVALINLATNARDAMPAGGRLTVTAANVTLRRGDDAGTGLGGDYIAITVADTGAGIEGRHLSSIFQPFFTTKEPGQGTGLGLSQVYGYAKQSGGTLTVDSTVGQGTTFTLYLPRSLDEQSPGPARAPEPAASDGGTVLLVEDNPEVARAIAGMLESIDFGHVLAPDGASALALLQDGLAVDLVLSDVMLGAGMSGLELEAKIRAVRPRLPVLLMTGYSEALADGAARGLHLLSKPFREDELLAALQAALADSRRVA